jgi:hypothetical protein
MSASQSVMVVVELGVRGLLGSLCTPALAAPEVTTGGVRCGLTRASIIAPAVGTMAIKGGPVHA